MSSFYTKNLNAFVYESTDSDESLSEVNYRINQNYFELLSNIKSAIDRYLLYGYKYLLSMFLEKIALLYRTIKVLSTLVFGQINLNHCIQN